MKTKLKKLILGGVIVGVVGTTGYHLNKKEDENNFKRVVVEDGSYDLENSISYDNLKEYSLCEIKTVTDEDKLYIAKTGRGTHGVGGAYIYAKDIFTGKDILEGENTTLVDSSPIIDYLVAYDMIKAKYSESDIQNLLEMIKDDCVFESDKVLEK